MLVAVNVSSWMVMLADWSSVLFCLTETTSYGASLAARAMALTGPLCSSWACAGVTESSIGAAKSKSKLGLHVEFRAFSWIMASPGGGQWEVYDGGCCDRESASVRKLLFVNQL